MNNVPFKMIIEDLNCGREIEFAYHGKKYSITNSEGYWNFCCDTDGIIIERLCPFNDKTKLIERVSIKQNMTHNRFASYKFCF